MKRFVIQARFKGSNETHSKAKKALARIGLIFFGKMYCERDYITFIFNPILSQFVYLCFKLDENEMDEIFKEKFEKNEHFDDCAYKFVISY